MMLVLLLLIENQGAVVTREQLLSAVWPDVVVSDDSLSRCISQLRKIFQEDPATAEMIQTVRSRGYRLAQACRVDNRTRSPFPGDHSPRPQSYRRATIFSRTILALVALIVVFGAGWVSRSLTSAPLVVYRDVGTMEEIGVPPDFALMAQTPGSGMTFFSQGELVSEGQ